MKKIILLLSMLLCFSSSVVFSSSPVDRLLELLQSIGVPEEVLQARAEMEECFSGVAGGSFMNPAYVITDQFSLAQTQKNLAQIQVNDEVISAEDSDIERFQRDIKGHKESLAKMKGKSQAERQKLNELGIKGSIGDNERLIKVAEAKKKELKRASRELEGENVKLQRPNDDYCRQVGELVNNLSGFAADQEIEALGQSMTVEKWLGAILRTYDGAVNVFDGDGVRGEVAQAISAAVAQVKQNQTDREQESQRRKKEAILAAQLAEKTEKANRLRRKKEYLYKRLELVDEVEAKLQEVKAAVLEDEDLQLSSGRSDVESVMNLFSGYENAGTFEWNNSGRFVFKEDVVRDYDQLLGALVSMNGLILHLARNSDENVSLALLYDGSMKAEKLLGYLKRTGSMVLEQILETRTAEFYVNQEEQAQDNHRFDFDEYDGINFVAASAESFKQTFELDGMWRQALMDIKGVEDQIAQDLLEQDEFGFGADDIDWGDSDDEDEEGEYRGDDSHLKIEL
jgi:hypothetical protein